MRGEFYTEMDIDDLVKQGATTLELGPDDRITDVARERARKGGLKIIWHDPADEAAPHRYPPIAARVSTPSSSKAHSHSHSKMHDHVRASVLEKVGNDVDPALVDDIIVRVFRKLGMN